MALLKGNVMDDTRRGRKPPLEVKREFTTGRLEVQVLTQTYELIVPTIRKPVLVARSLWDLIEDRSPETLARRMA